MAILPREQVTQRHPQAAVSAPGVTLWTSQTNLATCDVDVTDEVVEGEVELAHYVPEIEWDVETRPPGFGYGPFGEYPFGWPMPFDHAGVYQNREYGEGAFGEGPFGGVETDYYVEHGPTYWGEGDDEDGVYP